MKRINISLLFLTFFSAFSFAQQSSKLNFDLFRKIKNPSKQNELVSVFVQGSISGIRNAMRPLSGTFNYSAGDIAVVTLPVKSIALLAEQPSVKRIEAYIPHTTLTNDSMRIKANINDVHAGKSPLPQGYDGAGVVVGIIDTGIDFTHPDFKDSLTGKTRVKFIWDQAKKDSANTPLPYNYGQAWDSTQIDAGKCTHTDLADFGHGTLSCGIAAGNGKASPNHKYKGAAPAADLIVVAVDFNSSRSTEISDAVDFIYSKAQLMGKPCVINLSLGDYYGSHDGQDLQAQLMNNLMNAVPGRDIVGSAGNEGYSHIHLGYTSTSTDTSFTWFKPNGSLGGMVYMQLWGDTADFKNLKFSVGADKVSPYYSSRVKTSFTNIKAHLGVGQVDTIKIGNNRIGIDSTYGDLRGGVYSMEFLIKPDSTSYNWRLSVTGNGKFDLWAYDATRSEHTEMEYKTIPSVGTFPEIKNYKLPDTLKTTCSSFQCLDNVIMVANYDNKCSYIDYNGNREFPYYPAFVPERMDLSSSTGPTRDGRIKPDISAPGTLTIAPAVQSLMISWQTTSNSVKVEQNGIYEGAGGTSASSPAAAGVVALYLQKNPTATPAQIKTAITACTKKDSYTGNSLPDNRWGYGKIDAFGFLAGCPAGINNLSSQNIDFEIYPNPFSEQTIIKYNYVNIFSNSIAQLKIYTLLGQIVKTIPLNDKASQIILQRGDLKSGSYFYNVTIDDKILKSGKLMIL